mgnify:CR=1 FL=1
MLIDLSALRFGQLAPLFSASTCELFDCYGVTLEPQPEPVEASAALGPAVVGAALVGASPLVPPLLASPLVAAPVPSTT